MHLDGYTAHMDRLLIAQLWDEGVRDLTAFKVTQRAAGANFTVDVAVGEAVVQGDDETRQGNYLCRCTATENIALTAAPGSNSRYDLILLQINDPNAGGGAGSTATIAKVTGTAAASPVVPTVPNSALVLAVIGPISSGTASITNSIINDAFTGAGPAAAAGYRLLAGEKSSPGDMKMIAGRADRVNGWLYCNGQAVSRTTYARLFAAIATFYGVGDGSTTFNVPNLQDRMPVGSGTTFTSLGASGGEVNHTLTIGEMPSHTHGTERLIVGGGAGGINAASISGSPNTDAIGGGGSHNNMPPYQVISGWAIRT